MVLGLAGCEDLVVNVVQSRLLSKECDLLTFGLKASGNALEKDLDFRQDNEAYTLNAMYLTWIDKSEPAMLVPTFTMSGVKAMVGDNEVVSGKTAISFADDFDFTVVAENGDTRTWRVSLNCPQINTELPVLKFTPDGGDIYSKDYEVETAIELYSPLTKEGWWNTSGGRERC